MNAPLLSTLPNTLPAMQQSNSWGGCLAGKQASSALKQTVWKPAMGSATAWHCRTASWSSLVPRIILKWRLLSWEMFQQNQHRYQLHTHGENPKISLMLAFSDEKKNLDGKWLSDLTLQPIFTVQINAWLTKLPAAEVLERCSLCPEALACFSPLLTSCRLHCCHLVHWPLKLGSVWTRSSPAVSSFCVPGLRFRCCTVCPQSSLAVNSK